jgi:hypothetical protein
MNRRNFLSWLGLAPLLAAVPVEEPVQRIACIKWSDGTVAKRAFSGRDIEEAQSNAIAWLGLTLPFREYDEVMICNPGMDHIWREGVR